MHLQRRMLPPIGAPSVATRPSMPSSPTSKRLAEILYHALTSLRSPHAFHVLSLFPAQSADASWADRNGRFDWAA
ncbi:unnamed protein product, partial [Musa acuminata var. zebrina]